MQVKTLYRITREDGGTTVTPTKPTDASYTETYRLIADEGMVLTDGVNTYGCIDTDDVSKFTEIEDHGDDFQQATEQDYQNALAEMGVELNG